jgi:orotate phosphoribosyltransferase
MHKQYGGNPMEQTRAVELLKSTGALLEGHFLLTSGNHSDTYIQCAQLLSHPDAALWFMKDVADHFSNTSVDIVIAPAVGGIIVSYEIARLLGTRAMFMEREQGAMRLRRGFRIEEGQSVLVVEDVITTGGSVIEVGDAVRRAGGKIAGFGSVVNRSSGRFKPDEHYYFCVEMDVPMYKPDSCPLCAGGIPAVKPGSRNLSP